MQNLSCEKVKMKVTQSCPTLCDPMDSIACQAPLPMEFSRQEYGNGVPFLLQGIQPASLASPQLAGRFLTTSGTWAGYYSKLKVTISLNLKC